MKVSGRRMSLHLGWSTSFVISMLILIHSSSFCLAEITPFRNISWNEKDKASTTRIKLVKTKDRVVMDNGILQVAISNPGGHVEEIKFNGIDNVLNSDHKSGDRGYWDLSSNKYSHRMSCTDFKVITEEENVIEISFSRAWNVSDEPGVSAPVNVDKRYIMLQGSSGFYAYLILERLKGWPDAGIGQVRTVYKLQGKKFNFMSISDDKQRIMPSEKDRMEGKRLAYPEAVLLTNSSNPKLRGEVDDKYQYSQTKTKVHGWISFDPPVGFWMINPSDEFRNMGPTKVDLTSHVGPTMLNVFVSAHYAGRDLGMKFQNGEPWKMLNEEFCGKMLNDKYVNKELIVASSAYVGLAAPGEVGSWQKESKGYQFWTQADNEGRFSIDNVRPGDYNLYAWVPRFVGDYKYNVTITIQPGKRIKLQSLVYEPPRNGPTFWEIGVPDRSAGEFYVPDPYPNLTNRLYLNKPSDKFRQYGLWMRYADLYPKNDLVFKVGVSNYTEDWFFAHVTRKTGDKEYKLTTWQIIFELEDVQKDKNYTLQLALASASEANLHVRVNDPNAKKPIFMTGVIGKDNAIARHGIHGLYRFYSAKVEGSKLVRGSNTIFLTQVRSNSPFQGLMYDYIRFEGPPNI